MSCCQGIQENNFHELFLATTAIFSLAELVSVPTVKSARRLERSEATRIRKESFLLWVWIFFCFAFYEHLRARLIYYLHSPENKYNFSWIGFSNRHEKCKGMLSQLVLVPRGHASFGHHQE